MCHWPAAKAEEAGCLPCQQQPVLGDAIVTHEVLKAGLRNLQRLACGLLGGQPVPLVDSSLASLPADVELYILIGPLNVPLDIECISRSPTQYKSSVDLPSREQKLVSQLTRESSTGSKVQCSPVQHRTRSECATSCRPQRRSHQRSWPAWKMSPGTA